MTRLNTGAAPNLTGNDAVAIAKVLVEAALVGTPFEDTPVRGGKLGDAQARAILITAVPGTVHNSGTFETARVFIRFLDQESEHTAVDMHNLLTRNLHGTAGLIINDTVIHQVQFESGHTPADEADTGWQGVASTWALYLSALT